MPNNTIQFFNETEEEDFVTNSSATTTWLKRVITHFNKKCGEINYIFVSKDEIVDINTSYLNHTYPTDIITFNYNDGDILGSDIYICPSVIKENSLHYNVSFSSELNRVLIHGILHLIGFNDSTEEEQNEMRNHEDFCLSLL